MNFEKPSGSADTCTLLLKTVNELQSTTVSMAETLIVWFALPDKVPQVCIFNQWSADMQSLKPATATCFL